jgi:hypothetical protein
LLKLPDVYTIFGDLAEIEQQDWIVALNKKPINVEKLNNL